MHVPLHDVTKDSRKYILTIQTTQTHTNRDTHTHTYTHIGKPWHAQSTEVLKKLLAKVTRLMADALKALCNTTLIALATGYTHIHAHTYTQSHFLSPYLQCLVCLSPPLSVSVSLLYVCPLCSRGLTVKYSYSLIKPVKKTQTVIVLCERLSANWQTTQNYCFTDTYIMASAV